MFFTADGSRRFYTKEYLVLINTIKSNELLNKTKTQIYEKVFFSYRKCSLKKSIGEYNLEKYFSKQGYKIIYPEKLDFLSQLSILKNCKYFASTIGSCSHNLVFIEKGTEVILIPRANYFTGYQIAINDIVKDDNKIYYIDSSLSIFANEEHLWSGPFFIM